MLLMLVLSGLLECGNDPWRTCQTCLLFAAMAGICCHLILERWKVFYDAWLHKHFMAFEKLSKTIVGYRWPSCNNPKNEVETKWGSAGLEFDSIRRIQGIRYGVLEFLGVGTTFDIFQNIHILYLEYGVLSSSGYGVLIFFPLWSLVSVGTDTPYLP
ncbi:hypothetical protein Tco_1457234 [Tanacetum coccineum]